MDIPELSMAMAQVNLQNNFGVAMLDKSLELVQQTGGGILDLIDSTSSQSSLEHSAMPHIGSNIDISV